MPRKKKTPIEPIPDSAEASQTMATINLLLGQVIRLATGTGDPNIELTMSDQRRVLTWLAGQMSFASNAYRHADGIPLVQEIARHRYHAIASGLQHGLTIDRLAAEAGVSPSAIKELLARHQETLDPDPQRRAEAKHRRIEAARRAADRKKDELARKQAGRAATQNQPASSDIADEDVSTSSASSSTFPFHGLAS